MALSNTLKLYQSSGSPNSRRVRIFLAEKGLELTLVPVDLGKREQPLPLLNDGGSIILTGSVASVKGRGGP